MRALAASSSAVACNGVAPCRTRVRRGRRAAARPPRFPRRQTRSAQRRAATTPSALPSQDRPRRMPPPPPSTGRTWSSTPSARPDSAAKSAARAGWTVSSGPEGWKAIPGRVARVFDQPGQRLSMAPYGGLVAVVRCSLDQVGRGPGPEHHQLVDHSWVDGVHGQDSLDVLERRCCVVSGEQDLGEGEAGFVDRVLLDAGHDLLGARQMAECGVVSRPAAWTAPPAWSRISASDDGVAGGRETGAHDGLGLDEVSHGEQDRGQDDARVLPRAALTNKPLVGVARMFAEAAQVTLEGRDVRPGRGMPLRSPVDHPRRRRAPSRSRSPGTPDPDRCPTRARPGSRARC